MSQADSPNTTSPSRRALLAGAPAVAVAALAAGTVVNGLAITAARPSATDPIFAVIEAHHRSMAHETACNRAVDRAEEALPEDQTTWCFCHSDDGWTPPEGCMDAPEWIEVQQRMSEAYDLRFDAVETLLTAEPTTLAGAIACSNMSGLRNIRGNETPGRQSCSTSSTSMTRRSGRPPGRSRRELLRPCAS
jgi:hypothetical protein